jgi:hypothetical protein
MHHHLTLINDAVRVPKVKPSKSETVIGATNFDAPRA